MLTCCFDLSPVLFSKEFEIEAIVFLPKLLASKALQNDHALFSMINVYFIMNITILTPEKEIFKGAIKSVKVPGTLGQFQVLENHAPIVSSLETGKVEIVTAKGEYQYYEPESGNIVTSTEADKKIIFNISGGFIEVLKNEISLLVRGASNDF